jgi:hypothetical protein
MKIGRNIVAKKTMVKLRYNDIIALDPGAGTPAIAQYKANGMFDTQLSTGGHQPMGFDQWMTFYDHFTVVGSKITASLINASDETYTVAISLVDDTAIINPTILSGFLERNGTVWKHVGPGTGAGNMKTLSKKFSARKFFGVKDPVAKSEYKGTVTSDPTELAMFNIIVFPFNGVSDVTRITLNVTIEFIAVFTEPIQQLAQS